MRFLAQNIVMVAIAMSAAACLIGIVITIIIVRFEG